MQHYVAFLLGHSHEDGKSDPAGVIPAGYPNAGAKEPDLCGVILRGAIQRAADNGVGAFYMTLPDDVIAPGRRATYATQMKRAQDEAAKRADGEDFRLLVVHGHGDMSGHRDRLLFNDKRSTWGRNAVAAFNATPLVDEPYIDSIRVFESIPDAHPEIPEPNDWLSRSYNCIQGAYAMKRTCAILVEFGNLQSRQHAATLWAPDGLQRAADWLYRASEAWRASI